MKLTFDIDPKIFKSELLKIAPIANESMSETIENLLVDHILNSFNQLINNNTILNIKAKTYPYKSWKSFYEIVHDGGYKTIYLKFIINTPKNINILESDIIHPKHLQWLAWNDGSNMKKYFKFKKIKQKTKNKFELEILELLIPNKILEPIYNSNFILCNCTNNLLSPVSTNTWEWWLMFGCKICGTKYFCECFKKALVKERKNAEKSKNLYTKDGWPYKFLEILKKSKFRTSICHICTGAPSDLNFCHEMYGSKIKVRYGHYIKKIAIEKNIDEREAENIIRQKIGVPKIGEGWINETNLYNIICFLFPLYNVLREYKADWLGNQRIDIFISELNLAIEYQGKQHYEPIDIFGGKIGLEKTKERDRLKLELCGKNNIDLVYFKYSEKLSLDHVEQKLIKYLKKQKRIPRTVD